MRAQSLIDEFEDHYQGVLVQKLLQPSLVANLSVNSIEEHERFKVLAGYLCENISSIIHSCTFVFQNILQIRTVHLHLIRFKLLYFDCCFPASGNFVCHDELEQYLQLENIK